MFNIRVLISFIMALLAIIFGSSNARENIPYENNYEYEINPHFPTENLGLTEAGVRIFFELNPFTYWEPMLPWLFDLNSIDDYIKFMVNEAAVSSIVFTTEETVYNFRFLSVEWNENRWDENHEAIEGEPRYNVVEVILEIEQLTPSAPLVIHDWALACILAIRGFAFEDSYGISHYFSIHGGSADCEPPLFGREF